MGRLTPQRRPNAAKRVVAVLPLQQAEKAEIESTPQRAEAPAEYQTVPAQPLHDPGPGRPDRPMFHIERPVLTEPIAPAEEAEVPADTSVKDGFSKLRRFKLPIHQPQLHSLPWPQLRRVVLAWVLPVVLSLSLLFGLHARAKADPAPTPSELQTYLQDNALSLFDDASSGLPQIYYFFNHKPVQLTTANFPALHPVSDGQYVAYIGEVEGLGQVFIDDVMTSSAVQLSLTAPNEGISMHGNQVVWQSWDGQHWQIFYYNGFVVQQITNADTDSINAVTNGQHILYAESVGLDDWKAQNYDIASGQTTTISEGNTSSTASPHFNDDGTISTAFVPQ